MGNPGIGGSPSRNGGLCIAHQHRNIEIAAPPTPTLVSIKMCRAPTQNCRFGAAPKRHTLTRILVHPQLGASVGVKKRHVAGSVRHFQRKAYKRQHWDPHTDTATCRIHGCAPWAGDGVLFRQPCAFLIWATHIHVGTPIGGTDLPAARHSA